MGNLFESVLRNTYKNNTSDRQMSNIWLLFYFFPIISSILFVGSAIISVLSITSTSYQFISPSEYTDIEFFSEFTYILILFLITVLTFFLVNVTLIYELIKRRNTHFSRQIILFNSLMLDLNSLAENKGVTEENNLLRINRIISEVKIEENKKDPILWAILSTFLPFMSWFVYYFLMMDFYNHERREEIFWNDLGIILNNLNANFSVPPRTENIPNRSFGMYLILTLITMGLFGIYWVYILLRDPNVHFKYHIRIENNLINSLNSVSK